MLRHLIRNLQRNLVLNPFPPEFNSKLTNSFVRTITKDLKTSTTAQTEDLTPYIDPKNPLDTDEYVVPYATDQESRIKNNRYVLESLRKQFRFTEKEVQDVLNDETVQLCYKQKFLPKSVEKLLNYGITKHTLLECPWLITMEPGSLEKKLNDLTCANLGDINNFAPLLRMNYRPFLKLMRLFRREAKFVPHGNRIFFISEKLGLPTFTVAKYLSHRLFILNMPFDTLNKNLTHMINYNVSPWNIMKDLWAFRYTPKSVEKRLERAKCAKKDKIMPWMVRCPEDILQRSFQLSIDEDKILEGKDSAVAYIAERLGFTVPETEAIMNKHPAVFKVRVPKIKEVLDYLLIKEDFTRHEVAQVIRILCHSLKTTKERVAELKSIDCRMSSLNIVCKSKREYSKFVTSWKNIRDKIPNSKSSEV